MIGALFRVITYPVMCAKFRLVASPVSPLMADQDPPISFVLESLGMIPCSFALTNSMSK